MNDLIREIENADSIAITGHINPDGDCIGCLLYPSPRPRD